MVRFSCSVSFCLLLLTWMVPGTAFAQDRYEGCDSPEAHAFDFWPGEWEIVSRYRQSDGSWLETEQEWTAEAVVGGCVFIDFGDGDFAGHRMRGMGTRYYDPAAGEWVITWISTDAPGQWQEWRGDFDEDGVGDFFQKSGEVVTRIRWTDVTDTSAHWEYAVSQDGGMNFTPTWVMELSKRTGG